MKKKRKSVSYAKWGYIFILPFFLGIPEVGDNVKVDGVIVTFTL